MKTLRTKGLVAAILLLIPAAAHAQTAFELLFWSEIILKRLLPIAVTLALLLFFYGIVKFMASAGNERARSSGRTFMIWGIIALFVMVSVWGIVATLQSLFGTGPGGGGYPAPQVPDTVFRV